MNVIFAKNQQERGGVKPRGKLSKWFPLCLFVFLSVLSCGQEPIFYTISREHKRSEARIKGNPSNMVFFDYDNAMYIASDGLYRYEGTSNPSGERWFEVPKPEGRIHQIAATSGWLYVLTLPESGPDSASLYRSRSGKNPQWTQVSAAAAAGFPLQKIYSDGRCLFVGGGIGMTTSGYAVFRADEASNSLILLKNSSALLSGAASDGTNHYLSTFGGGVLGFGGGFNLFLNTGAGNDFRLTGIINTKAPGDPLGKIIAVARGGEVYYVSGSSVAFRGRLNHSTTGAYAIWHNYGTGANLFLFGFQGSTSNYGYREVLIDGTFNIPVDGNGDIAVVTPGNESYSSMGAGQSTEYEITIAKYPVNHLFQAPSPFDAQATLFASTALEGLFSYRIRDDGKWQWNYEE